MKTGVIDFSRYMGKSLNVCGKWLTNDIVRKTVVFDLDETLIRC
jgi:hypothetical protein